MTSDPEAELARSWTRNADAWSEAVRRRLIESRRLVTDDAIVAAALDLGGTRVLDVGCGEGWLARRLAGQGRDVVGFDGSARLIELARQAPGAGPGAASFIALDYDAFAAAPDAVGRDFDVIVVNFALLGERVHELFAALRRVVAAGGRLVIQTVHPASIDAHADGWQEERYEPLAPLPFAPMPWFFRTLESWQRELAAAGWTVTEVREPRNPNTDAFASLILIAGTTSSCSTI